LANVRFGAVTFSALPPEKRFLTCRNQHALSTQTAGVIGMTCPEMAA
jgi:hypothetical protein